MPLRIRAPLKTLRALASATLILTIGSPLAGESMPMPARSDLDALLWPNPGTPRHDPAGHALTAGRLRDRVVMVTFLTTGCGIACVIRLRDLAALERGLPGTLRGRVAVLGVTLDPARDNATALRTFGESLGLDPARFTLVDSDPDTAARQRAALRYPSDRSEPPDTVLVFDRAGQLAMSYGANPVDRPRLARDLAELDRFAQGLRHPRPPPRPPSETSPKGPHAPFDLPTRPPRRHRPSAHRLRPLAGPAGRDLPDARGLRRHGPTGTRGAAFRWWPPRWPTRSSPTWRSPTPPRPRACGRV